MFKYIYTNNCIQPDRSQRIVSTTFHQPQIVKAVIDTNQQQQAYTYITLKVRLSPNGPDYEVCTDTGCSRPLVDREWLKNYTYTIDRSKSTTVHGIGTLKLSEWATFDILIPGTIKGKLSIGQTTVGTWVTDTLELNLLLGM